MKTPKEKIDDGQKAMLRSLGISFPALEEAMKEKEECLKKKEEQK